jgi:hypothetical protein
MTKRHFPLLRRVPTAALAVLMVGAVGSLVGGCGTANQADKNVCSDLNAFVGSISLPQSVHENPRVALAALVAAGARRSGTTLTAQVQALDAANKSASVSFGQDLANLKVACQSKGFPVT